VTAIPFARCGRRLAHSIECSGLDVSQPAILDQIHDSIIVTDLDGMVTGCNRAASQIFGYAAEELIGKSVSVLCPEDDSHLLREQVIPAVLANGSFHGEQHNQTRSGDSIYVHLSISLLRDGEMAKASLPAWLASLSM
jgi:PAS domain S-box-containing protein